MGKRLIDRLYEQYAQIENGNNRFPVTRSTIPRRGEETVAQQLARFLKHDPKNVSNGKIYGVDFGKNGNDEIEKPLIIEISPIHSQRKKRRRLR